MKTDTTSPHGFDGNIDHHPMHEAIYGLCLEIEKLPASEHQTKAIVSANNLHHLFAQFRQVASESTNILRKHAMECFPEEGGQKHFARLIMESVADELIEAFNPPRPTLPITEQEEPALTHQQETKVEGNKGAES